LLEQEIVPLFYNRSRDGLPRGWVKMMKESISTLAPVFNTNRMVQEYMDSCYWPANARFSRLAADGLRKAAELAKWRQGLMRGWPQIKVQSVESCGGDSVHVGSEVKVKAKVALGP